MNFLEIYKPGDILWYTNINYLTGNKELVCGRVRTIYDKALILTDEDDCSSHLIDIDESEQLFVDEHSAKLYLAETKVIAKYGRNL